MSFEKQKRRMANGFLFPQMIQLARTRAVNAYLEKDFIEKVFWFIKTQEEVEPVRHRLENRVRAYLFVCMLAYRLLAVLQMALKAGFWQGDSWESAGELLQDLSRVERVDVRFGNEIKTRYLNLSEKTSKSLKSIGKDRAI